MNTTIKLKNIPLNKLPKLKVGMYVETYAGTKGIINSTDGYYLFIDGSEDSFHILDLYLIKFNFEDIFPATK